MKIVFDLATPKEARFLPPMMEALRRRGCEVSAVTRDWLELNVVLGGLGVEATSFGRHGGGSRLGKLACATERVAALAGHFERAGFDLLVTLSNPESSRAAFGLGIPVFCFKDLPESVIVSRLALPLASHVCVPWVVPVDEITRFGVAVERVHAYRSLDPLLWLDAARLDPGYPKSLGLDPDRIVVVARETETQATYVDRDIVGDVVETLRARHPDWQWVRIPRYEPHPFYDTLHLLASADLLIGGGGTMCIEAAYYGTPVIATRGLDCHYMRWLFERDLAWSITDPDLAVARAEQVVARGRRDRVIPTPALAEIPFPLDRVVDWIEAAARGHGGGPLPGRFG